MKRVILPMTKELSEERLQARKQEAEKARDQALNNARHWAGVIADCDYWLEESQKDESAEQNKPRLVK
jgi:guanylate kinase